MNTYLGTTAALSGVLYVGTSQSLPAGTVVTGSGIVVYTQDLYWNGGNGSWNASYAWHYSNGQLASWTNGCNAFFSGGGTIIVSGSINAVSMTFASGDYSISGGQLAIASYGFIGVGTGRTTISSALSGSGLIKKAGDGELKFNGTTTFAGICWTTDGLVNLDFAAMPTTAPTQWLQGDGEIIGPGSLQFYNAAVYDETHSAFEDETIDRDEMISILTTAANLGSTITANGLNELRAIANDPDAFNLLDYVSTLLCDVVNGNQANVRYHGQSLGNLAVGNSSTKLTNLIDKWFLGGDHPTADSRTTYQLVSGSLYVNGPSWNDMQQGIEGDCWLFSGLGSLANASSTLPDAENCIKNMIIENGDGTWTVRFYYLKNGVATADYVTVDQYLPVTTSNGYRIYAGWTPIGRGRCGRTRTSTPIRATNYGFRCWRRLSLNGARRASRMTPTLTAANGIIMNVWGREWRRK